MISNGAVVRVLDKLSTGYVVYDGGMCPLMPTIENSSWMNKSEAAEFMESAFLEPENAPKSMHKDYLIKITEDDFPLSWDAYQPSHWVSRGEENLAVVPVDLGFTFEPSMAAHDRIHEAVRWIVCPTITIVKSGATITVTPDDESDDTLAAMSEFARDVCRFGLGDLLWNRT